MARPNNPKRSTTPISIPKTLKTRFRKFAKPAESVGIKRRGYESDAQVLERIITDYEKDHKPESESPKPTYNKKT